MINKLHHDNADCSDLNNNMKIIKNVVEFINTNANQTLRCNTVIVKQFLNTGSMVKMLVTSL